MRTGIAGLTALAQDVLWQKPTSGAVFAFRGRRGDPIRLNDLDPQAYLADILNHIHDHQINRLDELLPWNWKPMAGAHSGVV